MLEGAAVMGDGSGRVYVLRFDDPGESPLLQVKGVARGIGSADGMMFVGTLDGMLYAFRVAVD
jgi:hypothetical protein